MITSNKFLTLIQDSFGDSKYKKWYVFLISKTLNRIDYTRSCHKKQALTHLDKVERHHICPKSIFPEHKNEKTNLAYLTPKEHFLAHLLLYKMALADSKHIRPLALALSKMRQSNKFQKRILNSNQYNFIRLAALDANKHRRYKTGYKQSSDTITKRVESYHKNYTGHSAETRQKMSDAAKGRILSIETRQKMSQSRKGKPSPMQGREHTKQTKKIISQKLSGKNHPLFGIPRTQKTRAKLSESRKGKYTGEANGMFGIRHKSDSILLMTISKIKFKLKNIHYDLNLSTWNQFVFEVRAYLQTHSKIAVCDHYNISYHVLKKIISWQDF